jgi:hypothetical protein
MAGQQVREGSAGLERAGVLQLFELERDRETRRLDAERKGCSCSSFNVRGKGGRPKSAPLTVTTGVRRMCGAMTG